MNKIADWKLEGHIDIHATGKPAGHRWWQRVGLAWRVLRGKDIRPTVEIVHNWIEVSSGGYGIRLHGPD